MTPPKKHCPASKYQSDNKPNKCADGTVAKKHRHYYKGAWGMLKPFPN